MDLSTLDTSPLVFAENQNDHYDHALLERCFLAVNKKHFKNQIQATIHWAVPQGTVSIREHPNAYQAGKDDHSTLRQAITLIEQRKLQEAIVLLRPLADAGHPDAQLATCHILKKNRGDWQHYAERYNAGVRTSKAVPAACYYPDTQTIAIHPHLYSRNVPQFVLRYLIYHECCHQIVPSDQCEQHTAEFMALERQAPHRQRAVEWLEKEGFPTIRLS